MRTSIHGVVVCLATLLAAAVQPALAQSFSASLPTQGGSSKVSAVFSVVTGCGADDCLKVVLSDTSTFSSYHNPDVLDGLFFDIAGGTSTTLKPWSAITPNALFNSGSCNGTAAGQCGTGPVNVGQQWGFNYSASGYSQTGQTTNLNTTARYGFAGAGYSSLTGWALGAGNFNGAGTPPALMSNNNLDGVGFGIVGAAFTGLSGAMPPLENATTTFLFQLPNGVTTVSVSKVTFAFGTAPDGSVRAPEPASLTLFGAGVAALAAIRRRKPSATTPV